MADIDVRAAQAEMLRQANANAGRLDELTAVAQMANNPGIAKAMAVAQKSQQGRFTPEKMGTQGFMLPDSGQFVESPMYVDEKNAARDARKDVLTQTLAARAEADAARLADRQRHDADMASLRQSILTQTLAARGATAADRSAEKAAKAAEREDAKADADTEKGVVKFSTMLEKAGVPEFEEALGIAEGRLAKHKKGELPGYGRYEGFVPDIFANDEQQMSRSDMQQAANILLKVRSGAAVTESESLRFLREVASGKGFSEDAMRNGWANVRKTFNAKKDNLVSSASDPVLNEYNKRSALPLTRGKKAPTGDAGTPPAGITAEEWKHMSPADRKLFQ